MPSKTRALWVLLAALGCWAVLKAPARRALQTSPRTAPVGDDFLGSAAGEEDPGAAVDSPAPPRPVGRG